MMRKRNALKSLCDADAATDRAIEHQHCTSLRIDATAFASTLPILDELQSDAGTQRRDYHRDRPLRLHLQHIVAHMGGGCYRANPSHAR
jgi:hypothetical protein